MEKEGADEERAEAEDRAAEDGEAEADRWSPVLAGDAGLAARSGEAALSSGLAAPTPSCCTCCWLPYALDDALDIGEFGR